MTRSRAVSSDVPIATVAGHFARLVVDYAASRDLAPDDLLANAGLAHVCFDDDARMSFADFSRLCEHAARMLGDPCLGLHAGESVRPGYLGSHGIALMSCTNVRELLDRSLRYSRLVYDACRNEIDIRDGLCIRYWRSALPGKAAVGRIQDELNMALWVCLARWICGRSDLDPSWIAFRHQKVAEEDEYRRLFRCPVHFGARESAIAFPEWMLDLTLPQANQQVRQTMDALCERLLIRLQSSIEPSWLTDSRAAILRAFENGPPHPQAIASALGTTEIELRARLAERGLSFRALVDDLRRQLALIYIEDPNLALVDIACLLGFSEQSAFQRAFKRWTAKTPGKYRQLRLDT